MKTFTFETVSGLQANMVCEWHCTGQRAQRHCCKLLFLFYMWDVLRVDAPRWGGGGNSIARLCGENEPHPRGPHGPRNAPHMGPVLCVVNACLRGVEVARVTLAVGMLLSCPQTCHEFGNRQL